MPIVVDFSSVVLDAREKEMAREIRAVLLEGLSGNMSDDFGRLLQSASAHCLKSVMNTNRHNYGGKRGLPDSHFAMRNGELQFVEYRSRHKRDKTDRYRWSRVQTAKGRNRKGTRGCRPSGD